MTGVVSNGDESNRSLSAAHLTIAVAATALLLLASMHVLSPEYDPAWRMVSEYANSHYGWVLSLMFAAWALSSWALGFTILAATENHTRQDRAGPSDDCQARRGDGRRIRSQS